MHTDRVASHAFTRDSDSAIGALARCRQSVLTRANELLDPSENVPLVERYDALPSVTGLLMTSLEELKVAEEELREQVAELTRRRDETEAQVDHYRRLFLHAPVPSFVTDIYGLISDVNLAATNLFKRDANRLIRKPMATLLATTGRDEFRRQLARVTPESRIDNWKISLQRTGDMPLTMLATVSFVPTLGPTKSGALYWSLRAEESAAR